MPVNSIQFGQSPWKYMNGLQISNNATTPNTKLDIATGSCLDSTGVYQIINSASIVINAASSGLNGLDTGSLAASTVYAVHLVGDPVTLQTVGAVISTSRTAPYLPTGYSVFALIGYIVTDASVHFLPGFWTAGNSALRMFMYDAPQLALNDGNSGSYAGVALTAFVPAVSQTPVIMYADYIANAAADVAKFKGFNQTGDAVTIIAPVAGATAHTTQQDMVLAQLNSSAPSIKYTVSAGTIDLYVCGYQWAS